MAAPPPPTPGTGPIGLVQRALETGATWLQRVGEQIANSTRASLAFLGRSVTALSDEFSAIARQATFAAVAYAGEALQSALRGIWRALQPLVDDIRAIKAYLRTLPETVRKYLVNFAVADPARWASELLTRLWQAHPAAPPPDPNAGAPWLAIAELERELATAHADPTHQVRVAIEEFRQDIVALRSGAAPSIPPWPATPG